MIRNIFQKYGLPEELAYVAMIESGFNPQAVSRAGAKGLWQFMEQTARRYSLRVDRWVDERLDPEKSTVAAALYLRDLFDQFGSWFLAKAAYNAGELKITEAVLRSGTKDFWSLTRGRILREETKRFVPAILAAILIGQHPERYGFEIAPEPPLAYDLVTVPPLLGLRRLASRAGISLHELQRLNPELRQGTTPPGGPYSLKVASGSAAGIEMVLADTQAARPPEAVHVVKPRETVGGIAKRYGVTVADLVRWNGLSDASRIFPGGRLRVTESK
jgi:membrane-bound lytic murein transglycosylase D